MFSLVEVYLICLLIGVLFFGVSVVSGFAFKGHGIRMHKVAALKGAKVSNVTSHNAGHVKITAGSKALATPKGGSKIESSLTTKHIFVVNSQNNTQSKHPIFAMVGNCVLTLLNPMAITLFLSGFGLVGSLICVIQPNLVGISLLPAVISGILLNILVFNCITWMHENMQVNSVTDVNNLIGIIAKVTVPIGMGKVGEVSYNASGIRQARRARLIEGYGSVEKSKAVIICGVDGDILLVSADV